MVSVSDSERNHIDQGDDRIGKGNQACLLFAKEKMHQSPRRDCQDKHDSTHREQRFFQASFIIVVRIYAEIGEKLEYLPELQDNSIQVWNPNPVLSWICASDDRHRQLEGKDLKKVSWQSGEPVPEVRHHPAVHEL